MKKLLVFFVMVLALCVAAPPVMATSTGQSDTGSWTQAFYEDGVYNSTNQTFNKLEAFMVSGGVPWEAPGMSVFSNGSWSGHLVNQYYAVAGGGTSSDMFYNYDFTGARGDTFAFDTLVWNNNAVVGAQHSYYSNGAWSYAEFTYGGSDQYDDRTSVPEPAIMLLLGLGLVGLAGVRRKLKK